MRLTPCGLTAWYHHVQQTHLVHMLGLQLASFQLLLERLTLCVQQKGVDAVWPDSMQVQQTQ
jgi:hypothetical protein